MMKMKCWINDVFLGSHRTGALCMNTCVILELML